MNKTIFSFYTLLAAYLFSSQPALAQERPVCAELPGGTHQLRVAIIPDTQGDDEEYGVAQNEIIGIRNHILNEVGEIDFVLHVGDVTNAKVSGVPSNEQEPKILNELQIFNSLFTKPLSDAGIPFYPIIGNHDYRKRTPWKVVFPYLFDNSDSNGAYIDKNTVPGGTPSSPNYLNYSYTVKHEESHTYFVLLDAFDGGGYCDWLTKSYQKIRQESPSARIFSIQHMNLFALAVHGPLDLISSPSANDTPEHFLKASTDYGIEGWFSGHNHYYHRAMYIDENIDPVSFDYTVGAAAFKVYTEFEREPTDDHRVQFTKVNKKSDGRYKANYMVMDVFEEFVVIKTYYSDEEADGSFSNFYLADEYIYSNNGKQKLIPSGANFSTISDHIQGNGYLGTQMEIIKGVNADSRSFVAGGKTHNYTLNVTTGWFAKEDWHEGKQDAIQSDVLVLRGLANTGNSRRTSPYLLKLTYDDTQMTNEQEETLNLISFLDFDLRDENVGEWYLSNYGTEWPDENAKKTIGAPDDAQKPGDFGVDTLGNYVWAYIDYHGDFCVGTSELALPDAVVYKSTIIELGDTWKYVVSRVDDIDNWNKRSYNDSGWENGPAPIGYNDPGLNTITGKTERVFMRKAVLLMDVEEIQKIEFGVDYDDGYVLYLNGNEIDRQRVDDATVTNESAANAAINIEEELIIREITSRTKPFLIDGENVFSLAVLNANSTSSDLSIYPEIYIYSNSKPDPAPPVELTTFIIDNCDSKNGWEPSAILIENNKDHIQGAGCFEFNGMNMDEFSKSFDVAKNINVIPTGAMLQFWYYVSDITKLGDANQVELGSAGKPDEKEYNWSLTGLQNGWNHVKLYLNSATVTGGLPDFSAINWFRVYRRKSGDLKTMIDDIKIVGESQTATAIDPSDIATTNSVGKLTFYPNPVSNDYFRVKMDSEIDKSQHVDISITNMMGKIVYKKQFAKGDDLTINSALFKPQMYIIQVKTDSSTLSSRFLIQ